jgi:hypothetical protein
MFVRTLFGLAALAATTSAVSAQPMSTSFETRSAAPVVLPGSVVPSPDAVNADPGTRAVRLLRPFSDPAPKSAQPMQVAVNPTAPPGFNAPCPIYPIEGECGIDDSGRYWASSQWLYWAMSGQSLPPLATASPSGTDRTLAGVLGSPNTATLFGSNRVNNDFRNGYRLNAGYWFDDCRKCGIEGDFLFLQNSTNGFAAASNGTQIIARPFVNSLTGLQDSELVSVPGALGGSLSVHTENKIIGGGVNGIKNVCGNACARLDFLLGFRYLNVSDEVHIRENLQALPGQVLVPAGTQFQISDRFATSNNFYGGLIGLSGEKQRGMFFVGGRVTVAFGVNAQNIDIRGSTLTIPPTGPPTASIGGLLAQPSNIGHYNRSAFAVLPEAGIRAGILLTDHARVFLGYNFLYLSNVVRAGDQIDLRLNPNLLPPSSTGAGPSLPAFTPKTTDFWAQGISLGFELRY